MSVEFPTREEFREWRKANPDRGVPSFASRCPLAECLRDRGAAYPSVYLDWTEDSRVDTFGRGDLDETHLTPQWAVIWLRHYDQGEELPLDDTAVPSLPAPVASESRRPVFAVMRPW